MPTLCLCLPCMILGKVCLIYFCPCNQSMMWWAYFVTPRKCQELLALSKWKQFLSISWLLYVIMKLPGMTSHFLKKKFKGASDSWQFLDHYMRSWNCQELLSLNGIRIGFLLQCYQMWKHFLAISWSQYVFMELPGTTYIFLKNVKIIKFLWWKWQESLSLWKQILAIPSSPWNRQESLCHFIKSFFETMQVIPGSSLITICE